MKHRPIDPQRVATRLIKARTPKARAYAEYLENADIYVHAHRDRPPTFKIYEGLELPALLEFRRSVLFGREYLVAWIQELELLNQGLRGLDAVTSEINVPWDPMPLPIIVAPASKRRGRSRAFSSVMEHETVHVNQAITGLPIPKFQVALVPELLNDFFSLVHCEYEAYYIEAARWPPKLNFGSVALSFEQLVLIRSYTDALETVFCEAAEEQIPGRLLPEFLDRVPQEAPERFARIGAPSELVSWFQNRWRGDVNIALQVVQQKGVKPDCAALKLAKWL